MKWIHVGKDNFTCVSAEDFEDLSRYSWDLGGTGYVRSSTKEIKSKNLHVYLLGKLRDKFKKNYPFSDWHIDHINRNKLDNRRCNLRVVTLLENARNKGKPSEILLPTEAEKQGAIAHKRKRHSDVNKESMRGDPERMAKLREYTIRKVVNITLGVVYDTGRDAAKAAGVHPAGITNHIRRVKKGLPVEHCGGYQWEHYDEDKHGWMLLL